MEIDIKPGSDVNSINLDSEGVVSIAILTTSIADGDLVDFDAFDVDQTSLTLAGADARTKGKAAILVLMKMSMETVTSILLCSSQRPIWD